LTKGAERKEADTRECVVAVRTECSRAVDPSRRGAHARQELEGFNTGQQTLHILPATVQFGLVRELSPIARMQKTKLRVGKAIGLV